MRAVAATDGHTLRCPLSGRTVGRYEVIGAHRQPTPGRYELVTVYHVRASDLTGRRYWGRMSADAETVNLKPARAQ